MFILSILNAKIVTKISIIVGINSKIKNPNELILKPKIAKNAIGKISVSTVETSKIILPAFLRLKLSISPTNIIIASKQLNNTMIGSQFGNVFPAIAVKESTIEKASTLNKDKIKSKTIAIIAKIKLITDNFFKFIINIIT